MVTNQTRKKFGLNPEIRITDVLQLLALLVAFTVWQVRTENRIGMVSEENKINAANIETVSQNLRDTASLLKEIQSRQIDVRLWIAAHDGSDR